MAHPFGYNTPQKRPNYPSAATTFSKTRRRQYVEPEPDPLYDELLNILNISINEPEKAGFMLQTLARAQVLGAIEQPMISPVRPSFQPKNSTRFNPYRRGHTTPIRPTNLQPLPELGFGSNNPMNRGYGQNASGFGGSPVGNGRLAIQSTLPLNFNPVERAVDFAALNPKPCMRLISSSHGYVTLMSPMHVVFNDKTHEWIVADKQQGIIFINQDGFTVRRKLNNFNDVCATALLNNGDYMAVLDNNGIFVCDINTGEKRQIFASSRCRGLAVTSTGDFVTVKPFKNQIVIVGQDSEFTIIPYVPVRDKNPEGEHSSPSFIAVSNNRLCVVDYTIGCFNLYEYDPRKRTAKLIIQQDCTYGVAQCRLTGGFMDSKGRILIINNKERALMLFDHTGVFLQRVPCNEGFCRAQYICVNSLFQAFVLDHTTKPHVGRLYQIIADPTIRHDDTPIYAQPRAIYPGTESHTVYRTDQSQVDASLTDCKYRLNILNVAEEGEI